MNQVASGGEANDAFRVEAGMLIRKPVTSVFQAVVDPEITTRFWFTRSSGRLVAGRRVTWEWEMFNHSAAVDVDVVEENERIVMQWPAYDGGTQTRVEWAFTTRPDNSTFVSVTNTGLTGEPEALVKQASDAAGGFALVLAGMKALLEHNLELNLVRDRFPPGVAH